MDSDLAFGWKPELEDKHDLSDISLATLPCSLPAESDIPKDMNPTWFTQDNQGVWPFCHAHMRTGIVECLYWLATKGQTQNFSRYYAAITDMKMDGDDSQPEGASIGGSLKASIKYGEAVESLMPYPPLQPNPPTNNINRWCQQHYSNKIADTVSQDATHRGIESIIPNLRTYKDVDNALVSGRTAVGFGLYWTTGWASFRGKSVVESGVGGQVLGGHAVFFFGWETHNNVRYPILHNSHLGWGTNMRIAVAPSIVDSILRNSPFGAFAVTNIKKDDPTPISQPWDWLTPEAFKDKPVNPFN